MVYAIWDTESANIVDSCRSEDEALADVLDAVTRFGRSYVASWALGCHEDNGGLTAIADGDDLIERAFSAKTSERNAHLWPRNPF